MTSPLSLRITDEDRARWQEAADARRMKLSEFVRYAVDDWLGPHDSASPPPEPARAPLVVEMESNRKAFKPDFKKGSKP